ncbi:MAG: alpha/beta hydrolase [Leptolyngbyaceae cyanobacterium MO_188.B28]|nr:alpha/beta hydrolase [Leptolyngbyaceae cyanobacterium MO_188.B28]
MILQREASGHPHIAAESIMSKQGYIVSDDFKLQYWLEGNGSPTIVVGSSLYYARTFSTELRSHLQMAFIDHRGFAPSNQCQDTRKYELDVLVDDIELARQEFGFEKIILIGHSGHAFMALEYAKKYPDAVSHLVLIGAAPNFSLAGMAAAERALEESVCPERKAALSENLSKLPRRMAADRDRAFITYCILMGPRSWFDPNFSHNIHERGKSYFWEDFF